MSCNGSCVSSCTCDTCQTPSTTSTVALDKLRERYPQLHPHPQPRPPGPPVPQKAHTSMAHCGSYQSIVIPAPLFPPKRNPNGTYCVTPDGCDTSTPMGGWLTPLRLEAIPAWVSGAPIAENISLQLTYHGVIRAIAVTAITVNSTDAPLSPAGVRLGNFSTTKQSQVFPGLGVRTAGAGAIALALSEQNTSELMRPITDFSQQALLDGLNALPLPLQSLDASEENALFRFTLDHTKLVAINVDLALYISYNALTAYHG